MKAIFGHLAGVGLCVFLLFFACRSYTEPRYSSSSASVDQDTLINMIEQKIAEKKRQRERIEKFREQYLPENFYNKIKEYYPIIRKYAKRYGIDWRLIVVQILKESRFKEDARSHMGAMGLMQIMPRTAREITRELDIEYITKDPRENITAGIYHMYKQLQYFPNADLENRIKLALASYNCGPARIFDARNIARFKKMDPDTWDDIKECLPMLTTDYWKLHLEVWEQGTPTYGYFYGYEQTIDYVDDIYEKYTLVKQMF